MLSLRSNMLAITAGRQTLINDKSNGKIAEKLASGYRINRAADDAAGLAISEKMRRQIRGLSQGTCNAQDGVSFVQVADGAMDEIHGMLQRMNELTIKSLNGTCSERDRAVLNVEFDWLRTEIDRLSGDTQFNDQPVFEEHEDSYYQIAGNRRWSDDQLHTVPAMANELTMRLPDSYIPNEYTLTVPPGIYTTQELVDEIDDALGTMVPSNPGFVFEYTDSGFCKLNFENADGMPTEIASVDGSLAYLFYDFYGGGATSSLLGTTVFGTTSPLIITKGQNDQLEFFIEGKGTPIQVKIEFPAKGYTRSQLINFINDELAKNPNATGVVAKEYGTSSIQITGGDSVSITGLKGNMFKYESAQPIYTSVFYDNTQYGESSSTNAIIASQGYDYSATLKITDSNNTLRFKLDGAAAYSTITIPNGKYTLATLTSAINSEINNDANLKDKIIASTSSYNYYAYPYSLTLQSTLTGSGSQLEFDTTSGTVYGNTYRDLFCTALRLPASSGNGRKASFEGSAYLNGPISLDADASLSFNVDGQPYTINNIGGQYQDLGELVDKLIDSIKTTPLKDKIKFVNNGNYLYIQAKTTDIQNINVTAAQKNATYKKLFTGTHNYIRDGNFRNGYGSITRPQGATDPVIVDAHATATIPTDMRNQTITIDGSCNQLLFQISQNHLNKTITLSNGTYSINSLVAEINKQFKNSNDEYLESMSVSYSNGTLNFTSKPLQESPDTPNWYLGLYTSSNTAWRAILGTEDRVTDAYAKPADTRTISTVYSIPGSVTLDADNNTLLLNTGDGSGNITLTIPAATYNTREALRDAVQQAIDNNPSLKDLVSVKLNNERLSLVASCPLTASGSFYEDILTTRSVSDRYSYTDGTNTFKEAFIIGRQDLTKEPIEIVSGSNDTLTFDFAYTPFPGTTANSYDIQMDITIPEGIYSGNGIKTLTDLIQEQIQKKFDEKGLDDFDITVAVGGQSTGVVGSNDATALCITVKNKTRHEPSAGTYVLDGIRGSAAGFLFYKTTIKPMATYITGTKNIANGITFKPGQNVLTFCSDSIPYQYSFPVNTHLTAEEFIAWLNDKFENGDDNGNAAPLKASLENGALKISHKSLGTHTLTDFGGSARATLFLEESGNNSHNTLTLLVGAEASDLVEIPRTRANSCSLGINSITISKPKYANKALGRIKEAIDLVNSKRSTYGSMQNRLDHTIYNNNNVIENTQASESAIRDSDMAYEMMERAKVGIVLQSSQSMMAQANKVQSDRVVDLMQQ